MTEQEKTNCELWSDIYKFIDNMCYHPEKLKDSKQELYGLIAKFADNVASEALERERVKRLGYMMR